MLRLEGGRAESLWEELLPERLRELPDDRVRLDGVAAGRGAAFS